MTHLPAVGPTLTSRSWLHQRLVVVLCHCRSPLLTPATNPIHGNLWINCVNQHKLTQVHGFLKCLFCFVFSLHWENMSANIISFVGLDLILQSPEQMLWLWCGFYCIWLIGKTPFIGLQGRCLFLFVGELREESNLLLSSFSFFILIRFLIYNNFLRLNYRLHR